MSKKIKEKEVVKPSPETQEQKDARSKAAGEAIRKVLEQYHTALVVTNLNIQTGRILPSIEVIAQDFPV